MTRICTVLLALALLLPAGAAAQPFPPEQARAPRGYAGFSGLGGAPTGYFGEVVGSGWGLGGSAVWQLGRSPLGLRVEGSFMDYASESRDVPIAGTGGRIMGELSTSNWIGRFAIGPQLTFGHGTLRPYLVATIGGSHFATTTTLSSDDHWDCDYEGDCDDVIARDTNYSDTTFAWSAGGGFLLRAGRAGFVDVGVRYVGNGTVSWLAEGDLVDDGEGAARPLPRRSDANVVEVTVGFVFAF
jgi:opacity protein-like surface antigen